MPWAALRLNRKVRQTDAVSLFSPLATITRQRPGWAWGKFVVEQDVRVR